MGGGIYPLLSACLIRMCVACVVVWGRVGGIYPLLSACLMRMCVACVVVWGWVGVFTLSSPPV